MAKKRGRPKKDKAEEKIDMKISRYFINIILFIILWIIIYLPVMKYSIDTVGARPSGIIAFGGITALIISYFIVKRINKSKLWEKIFSISQENLSELKLNFVSVIIGLGSILSYLFILYLLIRQVITNFSDSIAFNLILPPSESLYDDDLLSYFLDVKLKDLLIFIVTDLLPFVFVWILILGIPFCIVVGLVSSGRWMAKNLPNDE